MSESPSWFLHSRYFHSLCTDIASSMLVPTPSLPHNSVWVKVIKLCTLILNACKECLCKDYYGDWGNLTWHLLVRSLVHVSTLLWQWLLPRKCRHIVQLVTSSSGQLHSTSKSSSSTLVLDITTVHLKCSITCYYMLFEGHKGYSNLLHFQHYTETCLNIVKCMQPYVSPVLFSPNFES